MSSTLTPDTIGDRYVITGRIAFGGMGQVFRATDSVLGRTVAVKILPFDLASRPGFVEKFKQEARAAAKLSHPNVVQVHDWGESESTYFMVMEYIRGRNLREVLSIHGHLEPAQACDMLVQLLEALAAAHSAGLIHRDVKPENVLLTVDGKVKVTDFGIARVAEATGATGGLLGTVAYVAPEQALGGIIDARSDLYSAGCLLYELLTGSPPFEGSAAEVLNHHLNARVPAPSKSVRVTPELDQIVLKATSPEPSERFATASEMRDQILEVRSSLDEAPALTELTTELTSEVASSQMETALFGKAEKKRRWVLPIAIAFVLLVASGAFAISPTSIPEVKGLEVAKAETVIEAKGMVPVKRLVHSDEPVGTVLGTDPSGGEIGWRSRRVVLSVSKGPSLTSLGSLIGLPLEEAKVAIEEAGLVVGEITEVFDKAKAGTVLKQAPAPGKVRRGDPVNLEMSKGPEMGDVPTVVGKTFDEATKILADAGFQAIKEDVFNDATLGTVLDQAPKGGEKAEKSTPVRLIVSKGPQPFAMPDVRNKACSLAKEELEGAGLKVGFSSKSGSPCASNKVLEQDPLPGAMVRKGQEVSLYVS